MAEKPRTVPVKALATTGLELLGVGALTAAGWLLIGMAGVLVVLGSAALALSYSLSRR